MASYDDQPADQMEQDLGATSRRVALPLGLLRGCKIGNVHSSRTPWGDRSSGSNCCALGSVQSVIRDFRRKVFTKYRSKRLTAIRERNNNDTDRCFRSGTAERSDLDLSWFLNRLDSLPVHRHGDRRAGRVVCLDRTRAGGAKGDLPSGALGLDRVSGLNCALRGNDIV